MKRIAYLCPTSMTKGSKDFDQVCKKEFLGDVLCIWADEPDVPYLKIKMRVIKKETRYKSDRKKKWHLLNLKRNK